MKKRFSEERIVSILREAETESVSARDICRRHGISEQTFYRWKTRFGGMDVSDARRLKQLEAENAKLKRLLAEQLLVVEGLREIAKGKY
jgi:putative transposase